MRSEFKKLNVEVYGVSADNQESHQKFTDKFKINFPLLCDPDKTVMRKYDAFGEKMMYGKKVMGVIRSTVWIGPDGTIKKHWAKVSDAATHPAAVYEYVKENINT